MIATYVARITLENEGDLSKVEEILNIESFSRPQLYATSTAPLVMLVSPYKDDQGREVRSFELTKYLVNCGLLPENPKKQGPVTQEMVNALLKQLEGNSPRVELYRVSATDVSPDGHSFFNLFTNLEGRGPGPFVPISLKPDNRPVYYSDSIHQLFSQE